MGQKKNNMNLEAYSDKDTEINYLEKVVEKANFLAMKRNSLAEPELYDWLQAEIEVERELF